MNITEESSLQLSVIIPTYKEAENVSELIGRLEKVLSMVSWEVIFVDDDSPDDTSAVVRAIALKNPKVRCVQRIGRRGLSSACIEGMMAATAPVISVMDADLQHDETILPLMLEKIEKDGAEIVVGTRYAEGGSTGDWDQSRKFISEFATKVGQMVMKQDVSDPMSGFFMLRRSVLDLTVRNLSGIGFKILLDILATARDHSLCVAEVPYHFRNRFAGESKLDEMVIWEYGMLLADKMFGRYVPVRFVSFTIVGGLGLLIHMFFLTILLKGIGVDFTASQTVATVIAMIFNFVLNNTLTYRDQRLHGFDWFKGLLSFMIGCSVGAFANVGIATYLFASQTQWVLAAVAGVLVGAVWNYVITQLYTWGKKK